MADNETEFISPERFIIQRRLGAGGFGVVFQAFDRELQTTVALKVLHQHDAEALYLFKREFRALADITHTNLVALYELISDHEQWFFTMEMVEGVGFVEFVCQPDRLTPREISMMTTLTNPEASKGNEQNQAILLEDCEIPHTFNAIKLIAALKQLTEGLCALHEANKLHRDIKPSNVLVTNAGRVMILDFGLVTELVPERFSEKVSEKLVVGTPAYMSPEQAAGKTITKATDWYSVGVMLFQALTGKLPYTGGSLQIILAKQRKDAPAPMQLNPQVPRELNDLCVALLRREPTERPTGDEILRILRSTTRLQQISNPQPLAASQSTTLFVGREQPLAQLREAFQMAKSGKAVAAFAHGSSGIGKSFLVRHFLSQLSEQERELVILVGRCYQQESVPYKALDNIVDALSQYLKQLPASRIAEFIPENVLALARLFPVLRQVQAVDTAERAVLAIPSSQELRQRAFAALRELLRRLTTNHPMVIFIDDLQWGDVDSAALLSELLRPPNPPSILLIATYRSEEQETSPLLNKLLPLARSGALADAVVEMAIGELAAVDARELIVSLLGDDRSAALSRAEAIIQESGGSPFFINELAWHSQLAMEAKQPDNALQLTASSLNNVVKSRIEKFSQAARALLDVISVAGQPIKLSLAKAVAQFDPGEQTAIALMISRHLIRIRETASQDEIEPYHDRIRETVIELLSKDQLKDYHKRLATILEADGNADPERLMVHYQGAQEYRKASFYAAAAATKAAEALAFDQAARLYKIALDLRADENGASVEKDLELTQRRALEVKLGEAYANAGRGLESAQAYCQAARNAAAEIIIELKRRAAQQFLISGHIDSGLAMLRDVLASENLSLARTRRHALFSLLFQRIKIAVRGLKFSQRNADQIPAKDLLRIDTCWSVALGLSVVDTLRGADFQARQLLLALKAGEPYRIARSLAFEAAYIGADGLRSRARTEKLLGMAKELAEKIDHPHAIALTTFIYGFTSFLQGRWQNAYKYDVEAEKIFREKCTGVSWELDGAHVNMLHSLLFLGRWREINRRLPDMINEAEKRGDLYGEIVLRLRIGYMAALIADNPHQAEAELRHVAERWSQQEFYQQHFLEVYGHAEINLYCGDGAAARELVEKQRARIKASLILRTQVLLILWLNLSARAALAAAGKGNGISLLNSAESDARQIKREDTPWGNAFAFMIEAAVAAMRGNREKARDLLAEAERNFMATDMLLHAMVARRRRGELSGLEGKALIDEANNSMSEQQIKNFDRVSALLAPGQWQTAR